MLHATPVPPAVREPEDDEPACGAAAAEAWVFGRAVRLRVPHRFQLGEVGCGLYAVGVLMDYWHAQDRSHPTALVKQMDLPAAAEGARAAAACLRDGGGSAALRAARRLAHHAWGEGEGEFVEERLLDLLAKRVWGGCSVRRSSSQLHHGPHLPSAGWRLRVRRGVRV